MLTEAFFFSNKKKKEIVLTEYNFEILFFFLFSIWTPVKKLSMTEELTWLVLFKLLPTLFFFKEKLKVNY